MFVTFPKVLVIPLLASPLSPMKLIDIPWLPQAFVRERVLWTDPQVLRKLHPFINVTRSGVALLVPRWCLRKVCYGFSFGALLMGSFTPPKTAMLSFRSRTKTGILQTAGVLTSRIMVPLLIP